MIKDNNVLKRNYNMLGQSNKVWSTHMEHRLMKLDERTLILSTRWDELSEVSFYKWRQSFFQLTGCNHKMYDLCDFF